MLKSIDDEAPLKKEMKHKNSNTKDVKDGLLAIKNGDIKLFPPKDKGRWSKIKPGKNVTIKVNNKEIKNEAVITDTAELSIEATSEPPRSNYNISFSYDLVEAIL